MTASKKYVLVTGGASGIGKATAAAFAQQGADVVVADFNIEQAETVAAALSELPEVNAFAVQYDAAEPESCRTMVDQALAKLGRLDVLCNVAGIMDTGHFADYEEDAWERVLRINQSGVFYVTQRAIAALLESRGNVVSVASAAGLLGMPYSVAYCAAKAAVVSMTKCLAVEYAARGVRANVVCPGQVKTPMNQTTTYPDNIDVQLLMRNMTKTGMVSEPEDIANAILFLAADSARNITGAVLNVDDGQLAG